MLREITQELGFLEEFFSEVIYPAWPAWLAGFLVALALAAYAAYRLGWHRTAAAHPALTGITVAVIIGISAPIGWYTISPLFDRNTVCEASPIPGADAGSEKCEDVAVAATASPAPSATPSAVTDAPTAAPTDAPTSAPTDAPTAAPTDAPAFEPHVVRQGEWVSADDFHKTEGLALLIETAPGKYVVRVEEFSASNGPDVFVMLSPTNDYDDTALNLGGLKGTDGAFNYDVPEGTDVTQYQSVIIWCRQFDVLFGYAELM